MSQDKNAKLLKNMGLKPKMDAIEAAEAKMKRLMQIDDPKAQRSLWVPNPHA